MSFEVEATYENGSLKLDQPLPLAEQQRVRITIEPRPGRAKRTYGLLKWTGDPEALREIALSPEYSPSFGSAPA